eukprot:TRINITY_DN24083_c0_g1_i1.p1 TRINITY_DN24083_c0_g1~~TRINITY_DN24083_c0_g1_i1.p1  ORF type:complete len:815 (+),score=104.03 TRINITY_DN24083_c0_g1_i1:38-2482(+)
MDIRAGASSLVRVCAFLPTSAADLSCKGDTLFIRNPGDGKEKSYPGVKIVCPADHKGFCANQASQIITQASKGYNCCYFTYGPNAKTRAATLTDKNGVAIRVMKQMVKMGKGVRVTILSVAEKLGDVLAPPGTVRKMQIDDRRNYCMDERTTRTLRSDADIMDTLGLIEEACHAREGVDEKRKPAVVVWIEGIIAVNNDAGTIVSVQFVDLPSPDECATTSAVREYIRAFRKKGVEVPTPNPITKLIKQPFATGGNTIWVAAHLGTQQHDHVTNTACLDFCMLAVGISTPRAKKPLRSELMLKERIDEVQHYENSRSIRNVGKDSIVSKDQQRLMSDLSWIRNPDQAKDDVAKSPYVRIETIEEDHDYPYFEVLAPASRVGLAIPFILRFTVFGIDPWRKQWVQVVPLRGLGIAHNHATVMWDKRRGKLVLAPFYGDTHLNDILVRSGQKLILQHNHVVSFGTSTRYRVVMPKPLRNDVVLVDQEYEHFDADFNTLSKGVQRKQDDVDGKTYDYATDSSEDEEYQTRKRFTGRLETTLGAAELEHRSEDDEDEDEDIDDFINSVISKLDASEKSSKTLGIDADSVRSDGTDSPTPSLGSDTPSPLASPINKGVPSPINKRERVTPPAKGGHGRSKFGNKTKLFVIMHGDNLNKTLLMDNNATHEEFIAKIEQKLNQKNLAIYYEEEDGDRVEVDDDDAVTMFLQRREGEKFKIITFPAELGGSRMARAFAPSQIVDSSRCSIDTFSTPAYPVDPATELTRYSSYSGSYSSAISFGGGAYYSNSYRNSSYRGSFRTSGQRNVRRESVHGRRFSMQ